MSGECLTLSSVMTNQNCIQQGAEAKIFHHPHFKLFNQPTLIKQILPKTYRQPELDALLRQQRFRQEVKSLIFARQIGVRVPHVFYVDPVQHVICMEHLISAITVKEFVRPLLPVEPTTEQLVLLDALANDIGGTIAHLHANNMTHGDLTTSNMMLNRAASPTSNDEDKSSVCKNAEEEIRGRLVLIDFGLASRQVTREDMAVDLFVLEVTLLSAHPNSQRFLDAILSSYFSQFAVASAAVNLPGVDAARSADDATVQAKAAAKEVETRLNNVRTRRRKKLAIG